MAVEIADGFDTYTVGQVGRYWPGSNPLSMAAGYGGVGHSVCCSYAMQAMLFPLTDRSEYIFCFHFYSSDSNRGDKWFEVYDSAGSPILTLTGVGGGIASLGINGTSYTGALSGAWQAVTIRLVASPTVGVITVRLDGVVIYSGTGLNTGSLPIASVNFIGNPTGYSPDGRFFDHFAVFNTLGSHSNALPTGRVLVPALYPNADGSYRGFAPLTGSSHFAMVDDAQSDDDTSYVSSGVPQADSYGIESLPGSGIAQVHAVQVRAVHRKDDVNPKVLHVTAQSGSVIAESSDISPGVTYAASALLLSDDPNTTDQWTAAGVNAMQAGVKEIS
jgi:hypothetical protein